MHFVVVDYVVAEASIDVASMEKRLPLKMRMMQMMGSDSVVAARIADERVRLGGNRFAAAADDVVETVAVAGAAVWCARSSGHYPGRTRCKRQGFPVARYPCGTYHGMPGPHSTHPSVPRIDPDPSVFRVSYKANDQTFVSITTSSTPIALEC